MINAPHGKEFIFQDGTKARNILELVSVIETLNDHGFHHFVNAHKNDFANWVDHVLENRRFSERLREVNTKSDTIRLIKEEISESASKGKIGGSIMNIVRIEDHSSSHHENHDHGKVHDDTPEVHDRHGKDAADTTDPKEEAEEHKMEAKASRQWFRIFSRKRLSEKGIEKLEHKEEKQFNVEQEIKEELKSDGHENALWVVLYIALVILIIALLMYKLLA